MQSGSEVTKWKNICNIEEIVLWQMEELVFEGNGNG